MMVGIGEAAYGSITPAILADYFRPAQRSKALAFFYLAIPIGSAIGFAAGGWLGSTLGWRYAFVVCGLPGLLLSLLCLYIDEPARGISEHDDDASAPPVQTEMAAATAAHGTTSDELPAPVSGGTAPAAVEASDVSVQVESVGWLGALQVMWADKAFSYGLAGVTLVTFASGGMADWFVSYLQRVQGFSLTEASMYTGAMTVVGGLCGTVIGTWLGNLARASGRWAASEFYVCFISIALSALFAFLAIFTPGGATKALVVVFLFLTQFFLWFNLGPINAVMSTVRVDVRTRAFATATFVQHALGDAIASPVVGAISDASGLKTAVAILPFFLAAAALVWFIAWVRVPDPEWQTKHASGERPCHACCGLSA